MPPEASPAEPETLDAASVAELADTRTPDSYLDGVADYLKGGALTSARILAQVFGNTENDPEQIAALDRQMQADPRFLRGGVGGMEWDLACLPPEARAKTVGEMYDEAKKNHEAGKSIGDCIAANEASADKLADSVPTEGGQQTGATEIVPTEKVQPAEGTGSETIASDTPAPVVVDPKDEEIRRLRRKLAAACDELDAFHERQAVEKELTDAINRASKEVEAAKEVLAGKKTALATAHEELFLHASGDTQTSHPDLREPDEDDDEEADEDATGRPAPVVSSAPAPVAPTPAPEATPAPTAEAAPAKPFVHDVAVDQVLTDHGVDLLRLRACLRREIIPSEKPLQVGPAIVELIGCQWLVRDHNDEQSRWFLQRVLSQDDWQQTHEKEFGRCVKGFDQNDEAKHHRQQGGDECGLVVKVGRKVGVLGPEREGLVLVVAAPAAEPVVDGKSAGAGESLRDEQEQFVAGDTPGGVVNSDPND